MFADYTAYVLNAYQQKRIDGTLPFNLLHLSPANLRDESVAVCGSRYSKKDENTLRSFFGERDSREAYLHAIRRFEIDRFRPLVQFLKGRSASTDEKNIELLAWLMGLEPRPYQEGKIYGPVDCAPAIAFSEQADSAGMADRTTNSSMPVPADNPSVEYPLIGPAANTPPVHPPGRIAKLRAHLKRRSTMSLSVALLIITGAVYMAIKQQTETKSISVALVTGNEKCMYWSGDHYQPVSCGEKSTGALQIALDTIKVAHFKKITRPDTITAKSVKKVWYIKLNHTIEFYTDSGYHPVHLEKRLHPLTMYIYEKYILHQGMAMK